MAVEHARGSSGDVVLASRVVVVGLSLCCPPSPLAAAAPAVARKGESLSSGGGPNELKGSGGRGRDEQPGSHMLFTHGASRAAALLPGKRAAGATGSCTRTDMARPRTNLVLLVLHGRTISYSIASTTLDSVGKRTRGLRCAGRRGLRCAGTSTHIAHLRVQALVTSVQAQGRARVRGRARPVLHRSPRRLARS